MDNIERRERQLAYSSWEDSALLAAVTTNRCSYSDEELSLIEAEVQRRELLIAPLPLTTNPKIPRPPRSLMQILLCVLRWKEMTWISRGYLCIFGWTLFPLGSWLSAVVLSFVLGCTPRASEFECPLAGSFVAAILSFMALMPWFLFLTLPTGIIGAVVFTIVVAVRLFRRS